MSLRDWFTPITADTDTKIASKDHPTPPVTEPQTGVTGGHVHEEVYYERTIIILDASGSTMASLDGTMSRLTAEKKAGEAFLRSKHEMFLKDERLGGEIAVIVFDDQVRASSRFAHYGDLTEQLGVVMGASARGETNFNAALLQAEKLFAQCRHGADLDILNRIIFMSDGWHGSNNDIDPKDIAERLKENGVVIDCIGLGQDEREVDTARLEAMASVIDGHRRYRFIKSSNDLLGHYISLAGCLSG